MKNIFSKLSQFNNRTAIIDTRQVKHTYSEIINECTKFNEFFKKRGVLILEAENSYEFIIMYISAIINDQIIILFDSTIDLKNLKNLINNYSPDHIFCNNRIKIFNYTSKHNFKNYTLYNYNNKKKKLLNKNLSILIPTSGTTGKQKYVKLSYENISNNSLEICRALKINKYDSVITTMSPSYCYALSIINTHLRSGGSIILNNYSLIDKNFWKLINKFRPTNLNGVPYFYEILDKLNLNKLNLRKIRFLTQAGGNLENSLKMRIYEKCKKNNTKFFVMYGQTEASPRISILQPNLLKDNINSVGRVLAGGKITINHKKFNKKKNIFEGEIMYEGKNVFMGYSSSYRDLKYKKKTNKIKTGDIGYLKNELLYITGRKKRILKIFGIRISLEQLEEELKKKQL